MRGFTRTELAAAATMLAALLFLAVWSAAALRAPAGAVCGQDQVEIKPAYRVEVELQTGRRVALCNVTCALLYLQETGKAPRGVTVLDESSGEPLDAGDAFYVESRVFTHRESVNRIHVFADRTDAQEHADHYEGRIVPSPFAEQLR